MAISGALTIDLDAVQENYQIIDGLSARSCETGVSIKADAYGLGAVHMASPLYDAGARCFFCGDCR